MSAPFVQANTNGRLHPAHEPSVSPLNRGFLYGDAIYEVWRTYHGVLFAWEEHFARLESSARALYLPLPWTRLEMLAEIKRTVAAFRAAAAYGGEVYVRLQVSRGGGPIGLDVGLADRAEYVLLVQPCPAATPEMIRRGLKLSVATELCRNPIEALSPAWKTGNYLNNILGLREAKARGADEVLMLNLRGELTEASTSNIAFVRDGEVFTPRLEAGILLGITRGLLLHRIAPAAGVPAREMTLRLEDLPGMTECFTLSSTRDITPVGSIDAQSFTLGPDTVTMKLKAAFAEYTHSSASQHPELKM